MAPSIFSINEENLSSYANGVQDKDSNATIVSNSELNLEGNTWQKLDIGKYTIRDNTVLEFEFKSNIEGGIHGISLETDDVFVYNQQRNRTFKLFGNQNDFGNLDFDNYNTSDGWKTYKINVGDFLNGQTFNFLTFINDNDIPTNNGESSFRNIKLCDSQEGVIPELNITTPSDISLLELNSYDSSLQDESDECSVIVLKDNSELFMKGDNWQKIDLNYTVTKDTLLRFEFKSDNQGEIHGIGFDTDNVFNFSQQTNRTFQIFGTQDNFGNQDPSYTYSGSGEYESFEISLGSLAGETFKNLIFINDQDTINPTAQSYFRNIEIVEVEAV